MSDLVGNPEDRFSGDIHGSEEKKVVDAIDVSTNIVYFYNVK